MKKIYFMSDLREGFNKEIASELKLDIKSESNIVIISANPDNVEVSNDKKEKLISYFKNIGINFKEVTIVTCESDSKNVIDKINNADLLFLHGGNPRKQYDCIREKTLIDTIKKFKGILIGVSAGSMNLSKKVLMVPLEGLEEYSDFDIYDALSISDITIFPHFNCKSLDDETVSMGYGQVFKMSDLIHALKQDNSVYCLPDKSTLKLEDNKIKILDDDCYYYKNGFSKIERMRN